jgi:hypothetical protein
MPPELEADKRLVADHLGLRRVYRGPGGGWAEAHGGGSPGPLAAGFLGRPEKVSASAILSRTYASRLARSAWNFGGARSLAELRAGVTRMTPAVSRLETQRKVSVVLVGQGS